MEHSLFSVYYQSRYGISLHQEPFGNYQHDISSQTQYTQAQQLSSAMRVSGVEVFEYLSARDPNKGICVDLFTARAFKHKQSKTMAQWLCETTANEVLLKQLGSNAITRFKLETFFVNAKLPVPA